jgi:hypothetical protein
VVKALTECIYIVRPNGYLFVTRVQDKKCPHKMPWPSGRSRLMTHRKRPPGFASSEYRAALIDNPPASRIPKIRFHIMVPANL